MEKAKVYIKSILIPVVMGIIVGFIIRPFIMGSMLIKPPLNPPDVLFPIVWGILYSLMGISYAILESNNLTNDNIKLIYYLQLAFNALWPIFYFVLEWRLFAFLWIVVLTILIIIMIKEFYKKNKLAGILQIPYLLWTIFASYLNIAIYILNDVF